MDCQNQAPRFGKYQRAVAIGSFMIFQALLYSMIWIMIYVVLTLNYQLMAILAIISLLQWKIKRSQSFVNFVNNTLQIRKYYTKSIDIRYEQPVGDKCMFGFHPHSVLSCCLIVNMNYLDSPLSGMVGLASRAMISIPLVGIILKLWGVQDVGGRNMKQLMQKGLNIGLLPGGFQESTITSQNQMRFYVKDRKGFIKYAMEYNYTIYPVLCLNQHKAFWTFDYFTKFRLLINKVKIPAILFFNTRYFCFMPPDIEAIFIVGKGIQSRYFGPGEVPTKGEIDSLHASYVEELKSMYQRYKHLNGGVPLAIY